jgi:hypothetical protein
LDARTLPGNLRFEKSPLDVTVIIFTGLTTFFSGTFSSSLLQEVIKTAKIAMEQVIAGKVRFEESTFRILLRSFIFPASFLIK